MITWMKSVNKIQIAKVQPQGIGYKSVAYKKERLVYLCPCLCLGLFMSYLLDLFFISSLIFIAINHYNLI